MKKKNIYHNNTQDIIIIIILKMNCKDKQANTSIFVVHVNIQSYIID